ncbi:MAG: hypothetical protein ABIT96_03835 [Ferruginibacter sp.]
MKKILFFKLPYLLGLLISIALFTFSSCSKSGDTNPASNDLAGSWRVSLYFDNSDETSLFSNYVFSFNNNGQVTATNGSGTKTGTWSTTSTKFIIDFGVQVPFDKLNGNWLIEEKTSTSIKLKDDNPARTDKIQFINYNFLCRTLAL